MSSLRGVTPFQWGMLYSICYIQVFYPQQGRWSKKLLSQKSYTLFLRTSNSCLCYFCQPVFTHFDEKVNSGLNRLAPFAGGMKFATQIPPLLNFQFIQIWPGQGRSYKGCSYDAVYVNLSSSKSGLERGGLTFFNMNKNLQPAIYANP